MSRKATQIHITVEREKSLSATGSQHVRSERLRRLLFAAAFSDDTCPVPPFSVATKARNSISGSLVIADDGEGFDNHAASEIFGRQSSTQRPPRRNGQEEQYGNIFCMGSMRLAAEAVLFTRCSRSKMASCILLSQSLQDRYSHAATDPAVVACLSWRVVQGRMVPIKAGGESAWAEQLNAFAAVTSFKTEHQILSELGRRVESQGNVAYLSHLWRHDDPDARPELDVTSSSDDIRLTVAPPHGPGMPTTSLRAYLALLYLRPVVRITIGGVLIRPAHPYRELAQLGRYRVATPRLSQQQQQLDQLLFLKQGLEESAAEAARHAAGLPPGTERDKAVQASEQAMEKVNKANAEVKQLRSQPSVPTRLSLVFGLNLERRGLSGLVVFHCGRLIRLYDRIGPQAYSDPTHPATPGGVVAFVDLPPDSLVPLAHKQAFTSPPAFAALCEIVAAHMQEYWYSFVATLLFDV